MKERKEDIDSRGENTFDRNTDLENLYKSSLDFCVDPCIIKPRFDESCVSISSAINWRFWPTRPLSHDSLTDEVTLVIQSRVWLALYPFSFL